MGKQALKVWKLQGISLREGKAMNGKIAFVFPGHGSQYPDMMYALYEKYDAVRNVYEKADKKLMELMGEKLTDNIFTKNQSKEYIDAQLKRAEIMQTSIYTANYAMYKLVLTLGIKPDYLLGHSLGEFSSLVCADVFSFEDGLEIVYNRACVLNHVAEEARGIMFSLKLDSESKKFQQLLGTIEEAKIDYTVSIINSKEQVILSIPKPQVDELTCICKEKEVVFVQLKSSHGFHSPMLKEAAEEFYQVLLNYHYQAPKIPVMSSISEDFYKEEEEAFTKTAMAELLKSQLVRPFHFQKLIERLYENYGVRYFIEIGADSIMTKLVETILNEKEICCIATNSKRDDDMYGYAKFVSQADLYKLGEKEKEEALVAADFAYTKEELRDIIMSIVAEKTGYPEEILEDELDFEVDLGIDSVKQADIIARIFTELRIDADMVKEQYENVTYNTIKEVTEFLYQFSQDGKGPAPMEEECAKEAATAKKINFNFEQVIDEIKEIIAEKTGYPVEILEEDMDFEADLGIDSVKQADIVAYVLAKYEIQSDEIKKASLDIKIDTIKGIAELLKQYAETTAGASGQTRKEPVSEEKADTQIKNYLSEEEQNKHKRYVSVSRRMPYSEEMFIPSYLEGKKVIVIEDGLDGNLTKNVEQELKKQQVKVVIVAQGEQQYTEKTIVADFADENQLTQAFKEAHEYLGMTDGILNLYGVAQEQPFYQYSADEWSRKLNSVFRVMMISVKEVYDDLEKNPGAFCTVVGNIGGNFGVEHTEQVHVCPAIMAGFLKALKREIPDLFCKAIDFEKVDDEENASLIIKEMMTKDGLIEVGYTSSSRKTVVLAYDPIKQTECERHHLTEDDVIVFGGGGRGIMYEFAKGIAEVYGSTVILTGRSKLPEGTEPWISMTDQEYEQYKSAFMLEEKKENKDYTILKMLAHYESRKHTRELYHNIQELKKRTEKVYYFECDVRDIDQVKVLYQKVQQLGRKVTGIINGAGLPAIGKVRKKDLHFAEQVVNTKCMGFYNLYYVFKAEPLKFFHSVGSISGRLGMDGQVDYCAGSDAIVKMTNQIKQAKPGLQALTMEWTAWNEVGMAVNPTVEKIQSERGLTYITVKEGIQRFLEEVSYGGTSPEVLVFHSIGRDMKEEYQTSFCTTSLDQSPIVVDEHNEIINRRKYPLIERITFNGQEMEAEKTFYLKEDNFLREHKVNGAYVFAGVCHIEFYAEMIRYFFETKGLEYSYPVIIRNAKFTNFVKYFEKNFLTIKGKYKLIEMDNGLFEFNCSLLSDFINNKGITLIKDRVHSEAIIEVSVKQNETEKQIEHIWNYVENATELDLDKYYEEVSDSIEFGELYRHVNNVFFVDNNHYIGQVTVNNDDFFVKHNVSVNTMICPITIDCIGRVLLVGLYHEYGISAVPVGLNDVVILSRYVIGDILNVDVRVNLVKGDLIKADFIVTKENSEVVLTMNIELQKIKQYNTYGLTGSLDV